MKCFLIVVLALSATSAFAGVTGDVEFVAHVDGGYPTFDSQFEVQQDGGNLVGVSGSVINLEQQKGGFQGFALGRPFNVVCSATHCTDNGSTQMDIDVTPVNGGYKLSGTLNFIQVEATVTDAKISLTALGNDTNVGFNLSKTSPGHYSGNGAADAVTTFTADLTTTGTLAGLTDPATFIVVMVNPFVEQQ